MEIQAHGVTCLKCGGSFSETQLEGNWLDRHCPLCHRPLSEDDYRLAAWLLNIERCHMEARLQKLKRGMHDEKDWQRKATIHEPSISIEAGVERGYDLAAPNIPLPPNAEAGGRNDARGNNLGAARMDSAPSPYDASATMEADYDRNSSRLLMELWDVEANRIRDQLDMMKPQMKMLAKDAYYLSEWYRLSGTPLYRNSYDRSYRLKPSFGKDGRFNLKAQATDQGKAQGLGVVGEFLVFRRLLEEIRRPGSPLAGARLVPNVFVSWSNTVGTGVRTRRWKEIDLLVLARGFCCAIEVKHWDTHVWTCAPFDYLYTHKPKRGLVQPGAGQAAFGQMTQAERNGWKQRSTALKQLAKTQKTLRHLFDRVYDPSRLNAALVFAQPVSFQSDCDTFAKNRFVGWCTPDAGNLIPALRVLAASSAPVLTQGQVDSLAQALWEEYGNYQGVRSREFMEWNPAITLKARGMPTIRTT